MIIKNIKHLQGLTYESFTISVLCKIIYKKYRHCYFELISRDQLRHLASQLFLLFLLLTLNRLKFAAILFLYTYISHFYKLFVQIIISLLKYANSPCKNYQCEYFDCEYGRQNKNFKFNFFRCTVFYNHGVCGVRGDI